jgi:thioesterase domain-containing protein
LIYTSGSTGRPKGVAIEHRSAVALLVWARRWFGDQELAGMLAATSVNFDLSVFELFLPLAWGGRVILADNALALPELPARDLVRLVNTVPSAMTELVRLGAVPPGVATVCLAGEPLPRALAEGLYGTGTVERVWNLYGPSEDTTYSTAARVGRGTEPTIGRAVDGTGAWVLDRELRPLGIGAPGELYLSGVGLARGYLGRPALTAERFLPAPVGEEPGARMYRTGDRARWLPGGELQFLGRLDHQVKVRGFRIELGEVESALRSHPRVLEAAVLAPGEGADRRLLAYVAAPEAPPQPAELAAHLRRTLPEALVPAVIVVLPELPHTPNGKVDRKALAALQAVPAAGAGDPPRGALEKLLAEAFAEVLGVPRVSRGDGFFALGGHSLAAVRLRARLRERAHLDLPLPALFSAPTVETLAARLASGAVGQGWSESLVPLAQSGPGEPVFLVHPVGGQVSCYRPLATALSSAHPVWGLQRPGFDVLAAAAGLEELAAHYAEALVAVTPEGPFLLAGWSLGGVIAFEAARQLAGRGCAPRAVVLIDAAVPAGPPPGVVLEERAAALFARDLVAQHPGLTAREVETRLRRRGRSVIGAGAAPWQELPVEELSAVFAANLRAADGYRPAAQAVPLLVLRAAEGDPRGRDRWGGLAHGPFLERQLPGDHYSLLRPPGVERLAVAWAEGLAELTGEPEDRR